MRNPEIEQNQVTLQEHLDANPTRGLWRLKTSVVAATCATVSLPSKLLANANDPLEITEGRFVFLKDVWADLAVSALENPSTLYSPAAILLSAISGIGIAIYTSHQNRKIAKKRATFDYMTRLRWDPDYLKARKVYLLALKSSDRLSFVAEEYTKIDKDKSAIEDTEAQEIISKYDSIRSLLNEYEGIAVAIKAGALDEKMIKDNHRQTIIDTIQHLDNFISVTRTYAQTRENYRNSKSIWKNCQKLAHKWAKDRDLKKK